MGRSKLETVGGGALIAVGLFVVIGFAVGRTSTRCERHVMVFDKEKSAYVYRGRYHLEDVWLHVTVRFVDDVNEYRAVQNEWQQTLFRADPLAERRLPARIRELDCADGDRRALEALALTCPKLDPNFQKLRARLEGMEQYRRGALHFDHWAPGEAHEVSPGLVPPKGWQQAVLVTFVGQGSDGWRTIILDD
jgi:hypothetical protein